MARIKICVNIYDTETKTLNLTQNDLRTMPTEVVQLYSACTHHIDLSQNRLSDLNWLAEFTEVKELILDNNRLCEVHLRRLIRPMENVTILMLNKNDFGDLYETVDNICRLFPNLEYLSLHGNALCPDGLGLRPFSDYVNYNHDFYRSYIAAKMPNLKFLDHLPTQDAEFRDESKMEYRVWKKLYAYLKCFYRNITSTFDR